MFDNQFRTTPQQVIDRDAIKPVFKASTQIVELDQTAIFLCHRLFPNGGIMHDRYDFENGVISPGLRNILSTSL